MQLGSRWRAGEQPHPAVPLNLYDSIAAAEGEFSAAHSWTLTWLEGRPRVELFDAENTLLCDIGVSANGQIVVAAGDDDDDDDWLS